MAATDSPKPVTDQPTKLPPSNKSNDNQAAARLYDDVHHLRQDDSAKSPSSNEQLRQEALVGAKFFEKQVSDYSKSAQNNPKDLILTLEKFDQLYAVAAQQNLTEVQADCKSMSATDAHNKPFRDAENRLIHAAGIIAANKER